MTRSPGNRVCRRLLRVCTAALGLALAGGPLAAQAPELVVQDRRAAGQVAFSRDGRLLVTVPHYASEALLWEAATGRLLRVLPGMERSIVDAQGGGQISHGAGGFRVAFSPDDRFVAAAPWFFGDDTQAPAVWEVGTGRPMTDTTWVLRGGVGENPRTVWTASEVTAWASVADEAAAHRLAAYAGKAVAIAADAKLGVLLLGPDSATTASVQELPTGRELARLPGTYRSRPPIALSSDGRLLAVSRWSTPGVDVWDLRSIQKVASLDANASVLVFSPDGRSLATAVYSGEVRVFETETWGRTLAHAAPQLGPDDGYALAFSPDGQRLAVLGDKLQLYDLASRSLQREWGDPRLVPIHAWAVHDTLLAVGRAMEGVTSWYAASIELWPLTGAAPHTLTDTVTLTSALAFSPDGGLLAAAMLEPATVSAHIRKGFRGGVAAWRLADGHALVEPQDDYYEEEASDQVAFTPDGRFLLSTRYDPQVQTRDCPYVECGEDETTNYDVRLVRRNLVTKSERTLIRLGVNGVEGGDDFLISPAADRVLIRSGDRLRLLSVRSLRRIPAFHSPKLDLWLTPDRPRCAIAPPPDDSAEGGFRAFSPDGHMVALSNGAGATILRTTDGSALAQVPAGGTARREELVMGGRFTADGSALAMAVCEVRSHTGRVDLFDLATRSVRPLLRLQDVPDDVLFAAGGHVLVRAGGTLHLFDRVGTHLASIVRASDGEWLVATPAGLYDASSGGKDLAAWRVGTRLLSAGELPAGSRVPGLLGKLMRGEAVGR